MSETLLPLWTSLKTALTATLLATTTGTLAAWWMLSYRGKLRSWLDGILTLPLVLPPTVVGFLILLLLGKNSPIGQWLNRVGITLIFTWPAIVIAATIAAFPLAYKTVRSAFEQVDSDLIDAARTLGASNWRVFYQILLPLAWPGLLAGSILAFARALGEFGATLMVGGSIPGITQTMSIAIYFAAESGQIEIAIAWTILMVLISLLAIALLNSIQPNKSHRSLKQQPFIQSNFTQTHLKILEPLYPPQPHSTPHLSLNITKQLAQFKLSIQTHTNHHPLGIIGASGSGKSMTLRCIAGLETPDDGRIILNGQMLFDKKANINLPSQARRVGILFQNYALFPHMSVVQNIAFGIRTAPSKRSKQQRIQTVLRYLAQFEIEDIRDRYPHQISGGQKQRVALARVLASQPDILLLDEPLSALDTYLRSSIEKLLIQTLSNYPGTTLFVTHKLEEAYRICTNLLILDQGRVIAEGHKKDVFERPPTIVAARVTECKNFSRARLVSLDNPKQNYIEATDWNCRLSIGDRTLNTHPSNKISHIGIRAHHIQFIAYPNSNATTQPNLFKGWLAATSETQHRMTLYIKLHSKPASPQDYHLQAEVYREKWETLQQWPYPWHIQLAPKNIIIMSE